MTDEERRARPIFTVKSSRLPDPEAGEEISPTRAMIAFAVIVLILFLVRNPDRAQGGPGQKPSVKQGAEVVDTSTE